MREKYSYILYMSIFKIEILGINPRVILFGSNIDGNDTKIIHSTQLIHQDDSIQTIKKVFFFKLTVIIINILSSNAVRFRNL